MTVLDRALGFPAEYFTVLFAIPRMVGYLSHWKESLDDPDTKIMRPQEVCGTHCVQDAVTLTAVFTMPHLGHLS